MVDFPKLESLRRIPRNFMEVMFGKVLSAQDKVKWLAFLKEKQNVGVVLVTDFDAGTFLYATSDDTPQAKTIAQVLTLLHSFVDSHIGILFSGTTRGIRFGTDTTQSLIEAVDSGGKTSYERLTLGGSDIHFALSGVMKAVLDSSGIKVLNLVEYADNAAAVTGGLTAGAFYRTGDLLKVVH